MLKSLLRLLITLSYLRKVNLSTIEADFDNAGLRNIERHMDITQNPCEDFYNYACGKWTNFHGTETYAEVTSLVEIKLNKLLVQLLESHNYGEDSVKDKVWVYYQSCRRENKHRVLQYIQTVKPAIDLNWPLLGVLENRTIPLETEKFNWLRTLATLRRYGLNNVLMEELVLPSLSDASEYLINIDKPRTVGNKKLPNVATQLVLLMEVGVDFVKALKINRHLQEFELKLEKILQRNNQDSLRKMTIAEIQSILPIWDWQQYFEILLEYKVTENFTFELRNFSYFMTLAELLRRTDPEVILNYLMFHFLYYLSLDSSSSSDQIDCVVDVRSKMDLAINFLYGKEFYKKSETDYKEDIQKIFDAIRTEFHKKFEENKIGVGTGEKEFLSKKLDAININIGNLPNRINQEFVENYYENTALDTRNYCENQLSLLKLRFSKEHNMILQGKPEIDDFFFLTESNTARSSTPLYLIRQNLIVIPYGFLTTPIYHHNMPDVFKYSILGFNLAHEIAHGFDASGILYDFQGAVSHLGNIIKQNRKFIEGLQCLEGDNSSYTNERFADFIGLNIAFDAYLNGDFIVSSKKDGENQVLSDKSEKELFFLNFAQFFCGKSDTIFVDHDSDMTRLHESLMNHKEFDVTYQCRSGNKMYRKQKCHLW